MRILASSVQMSSQHLLVEQQERSERFQSWGRRRPAIEPPRPQPVTINQVNPTGCCKAAEPQPQAAPVSETAIFDAEHPQLAILRMLIERMTGRKVIVFNPAALQRLPEVNRQETAPPPPPGDSIPPPAEQGWGMIYDYHESVYEAEATTFKATGAFSTGDGREFSFAVELTMRREFRQEVNFSLRAGDALKDPLVINFSGGPVELTGPEFAFDLDGDGQGEAINFVKSGSAFLVLDRNGDNTVNDGRELFGPSSGDGFRELATYDADGNGWIDEADPVFQQLRLWTGEEADTRQLLSLGVKGVGAICLGRVSSPFSLKDDANDLRGRVRESGIYAREDGSLGTIQQIDLMV